MANSYEEKQEARRARLEARADKARVEAAGAFERADSIARNIPLGQPVLVGHHSEKRHRRDISKIDAGMRRGVEAAKSAEELTRRAAAVGTAGVSSDDPEAVVKLRAELVELEATRETEKAANLALKRAAKARAKVLGRELTPADHFAIIDELKAKGELSASMAEGLMRYARAFPWLPQFGNGTAAAARRVAARIEGLMALASTPVHPDLVGPGYRVVDNKEANRVQVVFDGKPEEAVRVVLKGHGFKWAPSEGAWQRQRNRGVFELAVRALSLAFPMPVAVDERTPCAGCGKPCGTYFCATCRGPALPVCACRVGSTCDISHDPAACPCAQCRAAEG